MKKASHFLHLMKVKALPVAIINCLMLTTLLFSPTSNYAQTDKVPYRIVLTVPTDLFIEPNKTVTVGAEVRNKKDQKITTAKIAWSVEPSDPFVLKGDGPAPNTVTLAGLVVAPNLTVPKPNFIQLTASVGQITNTIMIPYRETAKTPADSVSFKWFDPAANAWVEADTKPLSITPGSIVQVQAIVKDAQGNEIKGEKIQWDIASAIWQKFIRVGKVTNNNNINQVELFGINGDPALEVPPAILVTAKVGNVSNSVPVNYLAESPLGYEITLKPEKDGDVVTAEKEVTITATVKYNGKDVPNAPVVWDIPLSADEKKFVFYRTDKNKITLLGLYGDLSKDPPASIPVLAKSGTAKQFISVPFRSGLEPQVDVSWSIVPSNIARDNFGRAVSKDYYCIQVTIGNNSGGDLQLMGIGFDLSNVRNSNGELVFKEKSLDENGREVEVPMKNVKMPTSSYDVVRGSQDKRKLWNPRTLLLTGLTAVGQLMTGFNPYFVNIRHANNYKTAITIISNPFRDAVNNVFPDPIQAEINRLEQQALRDDKIIANNTTFKTMIFFPKNSLFTNEERKKGDAFKEDLLEVRRRLGEIVLVGYEIKREAFINRIKRFGGSITTR